MYQLHFTKNSFVNSTNVANIPATKSGFTLVELLVVIAVIGIVIAITVPAVQSIRESARRTQCSNKVRNISMAVLNDASSNGTLPSGINAIDADRFAAMSWLTRTLPYIEQEPVWNNAIVDYQIDPLPFVSHRGMKTPIQVFACPSRNESGLVKTTHENRIVATTDYLGVNGTNYLAKDGVFFLESKVELTDISDGLSNTLMIGERPPSPDYWYGWWYAGHGQSGSGSPDMLLGVGDLNHNARYLESCAVGPHTYSRGKNEQCDTLHFWSNHPAGANFAFCDGSIRFITYGADEVMAQMATRDSGEIFNFDF